MRGGDGAAAVTGVLVGGGEGGGGGAGGVAALPVEPDVGGENIARHRRRGRHLTATHWFQT